LTLHENIVNLFYRSLDLETGVVDQHINACRVGDSCFDRVWIGDVELTDLNIKTFAFSKPSKAVTLGDGPHGGDHLMALPGKGEDGQAAEATVAAGDKDGRHPVKYTVLRAQFAVRICTYRAPH
jgi:hypothetical protein